MHLSDPCPNTPLGGILHLGAAAAVFLALVGDSWFARDIAHISVWNRKHFIIDSTTWMNSNGNLCLPSPRFEVTSMVHSQFVPLFVRSPEYRSWT
jgi:hypothetical protein